MPQESKQPVTIDSPQDRLRRARERSGKSPEEVARHAGLNLPSYYDCEQSHDLWAVISLDELKRICDAVGIRSRSLFSDQPMSDSEMISFAELSERIKSFVAASNLPISQLEDEVGFELENVLREPSQIGLWSAEWLKWLCDRLRFEWLKALP